MISMVADWERKRTLDKMFQHVPPHLRSEFLERAKKEQDDMDKKDGKKTAKVSAPPFKKSSTGQAKKAGKSSDGDKKPKKDMSRVSEVMTGQLGMVTPRPMMVDMVPGVEVRGNSSTTAETSPDEYDGHTHTAHYDEAGNGSTSEENGHYHEVRSFIVTDHQAPDGGYRSSHPEVLPRPERTPGSEYKDYTGEM